jgi:hypothetical protein
MAATDPGIRIRTTFSLPWTLTETACRYDAPETACVTCAAGSNPPGTENRPSWTTARATQSSRKERTWPLRESSPVAYHRPRRATTPYGSSTRSVDRSFLSR